MQVGDDAAYASDPLGRADQRTQIGQGTHRPVEPDLRVADRHVDPRQVELVLEGTEARPHPLGEGVVVDVLVGTVASEVVGEALEMAGRPEGAAGQPLGRGAQRTIEPGREGLAEDADQRRAGTRHGGRHDALLERDASIVRSCRHAPTGRLARAGQGHRPCQLRRASISSSLVMSDRPSTSSSWARS